MALSTLPAAAPSGGGKRYGKWWQTLWQVVANAMARGRHDAGRLHRPVRHHCGLHNWPGVTSHLPPQAAVTRLTPLRAHLWPASALNLPSHAAVTGLAPLRAQLWPASALTLPSQAASQDWRRCGPPPLGPEAVSGSASPRRLLLSLTPRRAPSLTRGGVDPPSPWQPSRVRRRREPTLRLEAALTLHVPGIRQGDN